MTKMKKIGISCGAILYAALLAGLVLAQTASKLHAEPAVIAPENLSLVEGCPPRVDAVNLFDSGELHVVMAVGTEEMGTKISVKFFQDGSMDIYVGRDGHQIYRWYVEGEYESP